MLEILEDSAELKKELVENIERLEKAKKFNHHISPIDYNASIPVDSDFDYIKKGLINKIKKLYYTAIIKKLQKEAQIMLQIKVKGKENVEKLDKKPAIITCNHFNKIDSFAVRKAFGNNIFTVSGDFNNFKGIVGDIARYTGLFPLSDKHSVQKNFNNGMKYHLSHNKKILVYPEQAMWWNYPKPRPLQIGAFHWAVKYDVPVVPTFVTFEDSGTKDKDGYTKYFWTINVLEPIYANKALSPKKQMEDMQQRNFLAWEACYEDTYGKKLEYLS